MHRARAPGTLHEFSIFHIHMAASCAQRMNFYIGFPQLSFQLNMAFERMKPIHDASRARAPGTLHEFSIFHIHMAASCAQKMNVYSGLSQLSFQLNMAFERIKTKT